MKKKLLQYKKKWNIYIESWKRTRAHYFQPWMLQPIRKQDTTAEEGREVK